MIWLYLTGAILTEVAATLSMRMLAHGGRRAWMAAVVAGYLAAFALLLLSLDGGLPVGVAYGVWAATGVALTAVAGRVLFREPLTKTMGAGIGLIAVGVL